MAIISKTSAISGTTVSPTQGGTGVSNPTAHGVMIAEGSSAMVSKVLTAGQVLIGTTSSDPAAATLTQGSGIAITSATGSITIAATGDIVSIVTQVFTSTGTYTPTAKMAYCYARIVAGGGGGGGVPSTATGVSTAGGGGGGGFTEKYFTAATIGASKSVTIGAGGAGGIGGNNGATGGTTSLGTGPTLISATGGTGGLWTSTNTSAFVLIQANGSLGGGSSGGDLNLNGGQGGYSINLGVLTNNGSSCSGNGGSSELCPYNNSVTAPNGSGSNGSAGLLYGGGGSGAATQITTAFNGGAGGAGVIIITEYITV